MKDPSFVENFKSRRKALQALQILIAAKEEGQTNKDVLKLSLFINLFKPEYIIGKSDFQMEIKLKNIARDLKKIPFEKLEYDWWDAKKFFEGTRRK